jgi:hypothetical protein
MSFFGSAAPTVRGNYSGFSGTNVVTGKNGKILQMATRRRANANKSQRRRYTLKKLKSNNNQRARGEEQWDLLDPVNTRVERGTYKNGYFTKASGQVPQLGFNTGGIQSTGFVQANDGTNTIALRQRVAEQNFIRHLSTDINLAIIKEKPKPIDLKMYADRLKGGLLEEEVAERDANHKIKVGPNGKMIIEKRQGQITEDEAITIYNELIGLFIMHILYLKLIIDNINSDGSISNKKVISPDYLRKSFDAEKLRINMANGLFISGGILGAATVGATVAVLVFSVVGIPFIPVLATGTSLFATEAAGGYLTRLYSKNVIEARIAKGQAFTISLSGVIAEIHSTMFSRENKFPIKDLKDKLKYWGLSTAQVEYLFIQNPATALDRFNDIKLKYMEASQNLMEKRDAFNAYNQDYTYQKLQELRSAPGYKKPYFRNNTKALTQRIQQAKAFNDEYRQQQFVVDYNEAQQKLKEILSSGFQMRSSNFSNNINDTDAFILLFLCLPESSDLAPNEPLGPPNLINAAYPNEPTDAINAAYPAATPPLTTAAASLATTPPLTAPGAPRFLATTPPLTAPGGPAASPAAANARAAAGAANAAANAARVATAAAQQATAAANAANAAGEESPAPMSEMDEDENNKQTLLKIDSQLTRIRGTLKYRNPPVNSLRNYMVNNLNIKQTDAPLLFRLTQSLLPPKNKKNKV